MFECTFTLNSQPMSLIKGLGFQYPAYSGFPAYRNKPTWQCIPYFGAIPVGRYAIVDKESGGLKSKIKDAIKSVTSGSNHFEWFALYALDSHVDDELFCAGVRRGEFRIHAAGYFGRSEGCITLPNPTDFHMLRSRILVHKNTAIPGASITGYGVLDVKQTF
ncbi:MAG: DUF2778 domain-containing protein [Betaproteobacteria bacterium]|nr:DUF2778 domain-containing protein [Betaproteobacteria bacterium]